MIWKIWLRLSDFLLYPEPIFRCLPGSCCRLYCWNFVPHRKSVISANSPDISWSCQKVALIYYIIAFLPTQPTHTILVRWAQSVIVFGYLYLTVHCGHCCPNATEWYATIRSKNNLLGSLLAKFLHYLIYRSSSVDTKVCWFTIHTIFKITCPVLTNLQKSIILLIICRYTQFPTFD